MISQDSLLQYSDLGYGARVFESGLHVTRGTFRNTADSLPSVPGDVGIERERMMGHD
jgi:hypothetical protein